MTGVTSRQRPAPYDSPVTLQIYVEAGCAGCTRAREIADELGSLFPGLSVEVIDIAAPDSTVPDEVFAVPTYLLNGEVVSLGNPRPEDLTRLVEAALTDQP